MQSQLHHLSPHFYWFTPDSRTDRPSLGAVVGEKGTLILDAGASLAHAEFFLDELHKHHVLPPRYVALTHWHWDHIFGMRAYAVPIIAHRQTVNEIRLQASYEWSDAALDQRVIDGLEIDFCRIHLKLEMPNPADRQLAIPDLIFDDHLTIDLGDVTCQIQHVGGDHSADSCMMVIPEDKVLFLGDCLYPDIYREPRRYTIAKLFPLLDHLLAAEAETVIWGHGETVETWGEFSQYANTLRVVGQLVDRLGGQRASLIAAWEGQTGTPADDEILELIEAFLAGL